MSLNATKIQQAVIKTAGGEKTIKGERIQRSLREVLPVLEAIWSDIPWYKKVFIGLKALIGAIKEYVE